MANRVDSGVLWLLLALTLVFAFAVCACLLSTCIRSEFGPLEPNDMNPTWAPDSARVSTARSAAPPGFESLRLSDG